MAYIGEPGSLVRLSLPTEPNEFGNVFITEEWTMLTRCTATKVILLMLNLRRFLLGCLFSFYHWPCVFLEHVLLTKSNIIVEGLMFMPKLP